MKISILERLIILVGLTSLLTMTYFSIDTKEVSIEKDFILKEFSQIRDVNSGNYINIDKISLIDREHRILGEVQLNIQNTNYISLESEYLKQFEENGWKKVIQEEKKYLLKKQGYIIQLTLPHIIENKILLVIKKEHE